MKIKYVKGDVTEAKETIIAHGCNAQGVMGSGVAAIIRKKFPEAYEMYHDACNSGHLRLGMTQFIPSNDKLIANCLTQEFYGTDRRHVNYEAVAMICNDLNAQAGDDAVALPLIGAGLAGGDWSVISAIIEAEFTTATPVVYVFDSEHMHLLGDDEGG